MSEALTVLSSQVTLTDPHVVTDQAENLNLLQALLEPLVRRSVPHFTPCLAESWSVTEDARTWDFRLRSGVRFHNGEVLNAEAVVFSIERARSPGLGGVLGTEGLLHSYLGHTELKILNPHVVRLVMAEPMADLLDLMADIPILPCSTDDRDILQHPIGSGPYRMAEVAATEVTMTAHADYWQRDLPAFSRLTWQAEPDAQERVRRLCRGNADLITMVPHDLVDSVQSADTCSVVTAPSNVCTVFMCNALAGACTDARVRQALNYGFDQRRLIEQLARDTALPLNGPLTVKHFGHDSTLEPYPYAPDTARDLLTEAGFGQGLHLTLDVPSVLPDEAPALARALAAQYQLMGVETRIVEHTDRPVYAQTVKAKNIHDACCFDSSPISTFRLLREKFRSDMQGPWWLGFDDESLNGILTQAQATVDLRRREALYKSAHRRLHAQAPWIYLYNQIDRWGVSARLKGWRPTIHGLVSFV